MALLSTRTESHVLKLVHPGGIVELYFNPVLASEIMKKNPRHWVTRPDFFKFPWIVVSPQAILTPGNVFFIVPSHTIRRLLKNKNSQSHSSMESSDQVSQVSKTQCFKQRSKTHQEGHNHNHKHRNRGGDRVHAFAAHVSSGEYTSRDLEKVPKLKPCLKKKDKNPNAARSRDRRVRFEFTEDEVNTIKTCNSNLCL